MTRSSVRMLVLVVALASPGCASLNSGGPSLSSCRSEVAGGAVLGLLAGALSGNSETSRQERVARGVVGSLAGGALGYNACVQAYRRQYALQQRFEALEARMEAVASSAAPASSAQGGVVQTSTARTRTVVAETRVQRSDGYSTLVTFSGPALFASNRAELHQDALVYLQQIAADLVDNPLSRVVVMGHVDPSENQINPQALSQQRADAVVAYLVRQGVNPDNLTAQGLGTSRLADPSGTPQAIAHNRRFEVVLIPQTSDQSSSAAPKTIKS